MKTTVKIIEENNGNGVKWISISGTDSGTGYTFDEDEVFGITDDNKILDCEGCPVYDGDTYAVAVRNAVE